MKLFESEEKMQEWLEGEITTRESLSDLIDGIVAAPNSSSSTASFKIESVYRYCLESLHNLFIISTDENIALSTKEKLKPDILAYAPETQSMVIFELKNIGGPTRQSATELSAYCAEINNYLPFISDADIVNIIISNEWPTLLRKHIVQDILWRGRKLLCLRPYQAGSELRLQAVSPNDLGCLEFDLKMAPQHVGGFQICLYDNELYSKDPNRSRLDQFQPQMRSAMAAMASKGNLAGNHGFAFLWKDNWGESLAPYSITILNVAAFNRLDRFLIDLPEGVEPSEIQKRFFKLVADYAPEGHGQSLNELLEEAQRFLKGFCSPQPEGFMTWPALHNSMKQRAEYVSFSAWGFFGERHLDLLQKKYEAGQSPIFDSADLGLELVASVIDRNVPYIDLAYMNWDDGDDDGGEDTEDFY
jgi:hypothetical protein